MLSAYARAWDTSLLPEGYPSAQRIKQDIDCVVDKVYLQIFHARSIVVPGLGIRRGRRYERSIVQLPRGRKMKKKEFRKKWIHLDVQKEYEKKLKQVSVLDSENVTIT